MMKKIQDLKVSIEQNPGCLRYIEDYTTYTTQLYRDYDEPW